MANIFTHAYTNVLENARLDLDFIKHEVIQAKEIGALACLLLTFYICFKTFYMPAGNPEMIANAFMRFVTLYGLLMLYWWMYRDQSDSMVSMLRIEILITNAFILGYVGTYI